jgi:hypothetical protein
LMAVLCAVVQSGCSFDEHVLHVRKFRDLGGSVKLTDVDFACGVRVVILIRSLWRRRQ